jgi:diguanylate cyclase (GGDEF)-like protein/PAS domain S-box-containing protein
LNTQVANRRLACRGDSPEPHRLFLQNGGLFDLGGSRPPCGRNTGGTPVHDIPVGKGLSHTERTPPYAFVNVEELALPLGQVAGSSMDIALPNEDDREAWSANSRPMPAQEPDFDRLVELAARVFGVPIAAISINGWDRKFIKARFGIDALAIDLSSFFSGCAGSGDGVFITLDATPYPQLAPRPDAARAPQIGFFAGARLQSTSGQSLGEFCIFDHAPRRKFSDRDRRTLLDFAAITVDHIERRRLAIAERASESRFENIASTSPDGIICTDRAGTITFWNKAAENLFGYSATETIGQNLQIIVPERFRNQTSEVTEIAGAGSSSLMGSSNVIGSTISLIARRRNGSEFPIELSLSQWLQDGEASFGAIIRDVTQRLASEEWLFRLAHLDSLTELPNRMVLRNRIDEAVANEAPACVLLIDLDGFKDVNDTLGHSAGDMLLKMVAERILALVGGNDTVARLGGDEFAALLPGLDDPLRVAAISDALIKAIAEPFTIDGQPVIIGASIGIALCPAHGRMAEDLLANADLALYQAKAEGRHCRRFFMPALRHAALNRRTYEIELRMAAAEKQFELHYQPVVHISDGALIGAEALMRWRHPQRGILSPGAFFSVLETSLLAAVIGDWALETACAQTAMWRRSAMPDFRISVNLFGVQFKTGDIESTVRETLARHQLPAEALELEITENIILRHDEAMIRPMRNLHHFGVGIAFDDYGTGYASLSLLKRFPLSRLKVDRSFVRDVCTDPEDAAIVKAILYLGQSFDLGVIAEGVETAEQQAFLSANGCLEAQGFLFGKPMPAEAFEQQFLVKRVKRVRSA